MNEVLAHLLDAVRHAPSHLNAQPWRVSTPPPDTLPLRAGGETPPDPRCAERGDDKSIACVAGSYGPSPESLGPTRGGLHLASAQAILLRPPPSPRIGGLGASRPQLAAGGAGGGEVDPLDPDARCLWISLGCATENALLTLEQIGFDGTCHLDNGVIIEWRPRSAPPPDPRLYRMIPLRRTSRRPFDPAEAIPAEGVEWLTADQRPAVRRQMLADMTDPATAREAYRWMRFFPGPHRDGLTAECLGMRPWEARLAAVLTHPILPAWFRRLLLDDVPPSPLWGVLLAHTHDPEGWFDAGRRLQRLWLEATARGVSLHPVPAPLDPPACLMFRFGTSPPVPAAPRLPADELLE